MKKILLPLSLLIVLLWAIEQPVEVLTLSASFFPLRKAFTVLTGALAFGWMSAAMLLALRPVWLEQRLGGLDQLFALHKWTGIGAILLVVTHWLLELSPRTLISWGWVSAPGSRPHHGGGGDLLVHLARETGEWAAWAMIGLGVVALLRYVPYGWFRKLHKAFPLVFLVGAFHSMTLAPGSLLGSPLSILILLMSLGGSAIAALSLAQMIGRRQQTRGRVISVSTAENGVVTVMVQPSAAWPGHRAGQFALLVLDAKEGSHPFTIASEWRPGAALRFTIKPLGDYTRRLALAIRPGQPAVIEGPYGRFDFEDSSERQIWVAGGIGIAPFIARLETLAARNNQQKVDLFYSTTTEQDARFPENLEELCRRAGVALHRRVVNRDGLLTPQDIGALVSASSSVWFCGPVPWGKTLSRVLRARFGLLSTKFHQEMFQFR